MKLFKIIRNPIIIKRAVVISGLAKWGKLMHSKDTVLHRFKRGVYWNVIVFVENHKCRWTLYSKSPNPMSSSSSSSSSFFSSAKTKAKQAGTLATRKWGSAGFYVSYPSWQQEQRQRPQEQQQPGQQHHRKAWSRASRGLKVSGWEGVSYWVKCVRVWY